MKKRGRGRPPGSKNKEGTASAGVATPASNKRPRDVWVVESRKETSDRRHDYIEYKDIHGVFASLRAANVEARKDQAKEVDGTSEEDSGNMLYVEKIDSDDKPTLYYSHLQETSEYDTETTPDHPGAAVPSALRNSRIDRRVGREESPSFHQRSPFPAAARGPATGRRNLNHA